MLAALCVSRFATVSLLKSASGVSWYSPVFPLSPYDSLLCVCVCVLKFPLINKDTIYFIKAHLDPIRLHFNMITSTKALFPNKTIFTGTGIRTYVIWGNTIQPKINVMCLSMGFSQHLSSLMCFELPRRGFMSVISFWKLLSYFSFKYPFCSFLHVFSFRYSNWVYVTTFNSFLISIVLRKCVILFSVFFFSENFSLESLYQMTFKLIDSFSAMAGLLRRPSKAFFISVTIFGF